MAIFPSEAWLMALEEKLNTDERYGHIARNWEGDILFVIGPDSVLTHVVVVYLDLWHGKCRDTFFLSSSSDHKASFIFKAPYGNFVKVLTGELEPMQAMMTRVLGIHGNMAVLMRNIPTVLDFVRCCREVTTGKI